MIKSTNINGKHQSSSKTDPSSELIEGILPILRRSRSLILVSCLMGLLAGVVYLLLTTPVYESRAEILLMQNNSASLASERSRAQAAIPDDLLSTHMSLIQSKRIINQALRKAKLDDLPSIVSQLSEDVTPEEYVIENLYVTRGGEGTARDARVLTVAFRHTNPEDSQRIASAILDEYKAFVASKFRDVNEEAVTLINKARLDLEEDIEGLANKYRKFRSEAPLLSSTEGGANVHAMLYDELSVELSELTNSIDESRGRLELVKEQLKRLEEADAHPLEKLALIDDRNAERLGILVSVERGESQTAAFQALQPERMAGATTEYNSLLNLKSQLTQATQEYGPKHPSVKALQTQIEKIEEFFNERQPLLTVDEDELQLTPDDVMGAYIRLLENDLLALKTRHTDLQAQIAAVETKAKELIDYELQDEMLTREIARSEELYDSIVSRLRDINMQKDASGLIQEIIEEPSLGKQVAPSNMIAAVLAVLATLLLAGSAVLFSEISDQRIHSANQLEELYQTRIISHMPDLQSDPQSKDLIRRIAAKKPTISPYVLSYHDPKSAMSECVRTIRTKLLFDLKGEHSLLAITSPSQGDGKTTIATNLAISVAQSGRSVLLVDCDMRRPAVHSLLGVKSEAGLSSLLKGQVEIPDCIVAGPVDRLSVLPVGPIPEDPAELLSSDQFETLLQKLKSKYEFVILDCPPVLPVTDSAIIAPLADSVVLVTTSLDNRGIPKARQCNRLLESCGAELAGLVVNRTSKKTSGYDYEGYGEDYSEYSLYREMAVSR